MTGDKIVWQTAATRHGMSAQKQHAKSADQQQERDAGGRMAALTLSVLYQVPVVQHAVEDALALW